jgi:hypothetical protein
MVDFWTAYCAAEDRILEAIFTFFSYGFDNPHQRTEGTQRLRYRSVMRSMNRGLTELRALESGNAHPDELAAAESFTEFSSIMFRAMGTDRPPEMPVGRRSYPLWRHYIHAYEILMLVVKRILFDNQLSKLPVGSQHLELAARELQLLRAAEEIPVSDESVNTLQELLDVSAELLARKRSLGAR